MVHLALVRPLDFLGMRVCRFGLWARPLWIGLAVMDFVRRVWIAVVHLARVRRTLCLGAPIIACVAEWNIRRPFCLGRRRWGEPVCKFVKCVETHAKHRYSVPGYTYEYWLDIPYWVCAYANRQHEGSEEFAPARKAARRAPPSVAVIGAYIYVCRYVFVCLCVCKHIAIRIHTHVDIWSQTHTRI